MDRIPAEIYKAAGPVTWQTFHSLLMNIWEEDMPKDFKDATLVTLFKNKGSKADCGNYLGISLLSTAGKILACVILKYFITSISEENVPEAQCFPSWPQHHRPGFCNLTVPWEVYQTECGSVCHLYSYDQGIWYGQQRSTLSYTVKTQVYEKICQSHLPFFMLFFSVGNF